MFGLEVSGERVRYWGARAIYRGDGNFELLWDRQSCEGVAEDKDSKLFLKWINKKALPWLRKELNRLCLGTDASDKLLYKSGTYELHATPGKSFGYLYIGVVELVGEKSAEQSPKPTKKAFKDLDGTTNRSLEFMANLNKIGTITKVEGVRRVYQNRCYTGVLVTGSLGTCFFTGFGWGYGGTGPHGTKTLLTKLGLEDEFSRINDIPSPDFNGQKETFWTIDANKVTA